MEGIVSILKDDYNDFVNFYFLIRRIDYKCILFDSL